MAGKGIRIDFIAEVRKFLGGTRDVQGALDDVADSLDDLTRDASRAGDAVGDGLSDGSKDAGKALDRLEKKLRDTFDDTRTQTRRAGDDIGDNVKRGARDAEEGLSTLKDEAQQTARETAASFDGTADSLVGMAQEVAANALGGFGPLGMAAGLALAAGAGILFSEYQKKTEETKQLVSDMYDDMLASGQAFASASFVNDRITEIVKNDDLVRTFSEAARTIGVDLTTAVRAAAGDTAAMAEVTQAATEWQAKFGDEAGSTNAAVNGLVQAVDQQNDALDSAASKADLARGAMVATSEATRAYDEALAGVNDSLTDASTKIAENQETWAGNAAQLRTENLGVLQELAGQLGDVNQAAADANVSGAALTKVQQDQAAAFLGAATQAGLTADEAYNLAVRYGLIPAAVDTEVKKTGVNVADIDALKAAWDRVPDVKSTRYAVSVFESIQPIRTAADLIDGRAAGGPFRAGEPLLVGEHRPEVIVPSSAGRVVPNARGLTGGPSVVVNVTADPRIAESVARASARAVGDALRRYRVA